MPPKVQQAAEWRLQASRRLVLGSGIARALCLSWGDLLQFVAGGNTPLGHYRFPDAVEDSRGWGYIGWFVYVPGSRLEEGEIQL